MIDPTKIDSINCEYNIHNFSKVFMTELTITWYDYMSRQQCFDSTARNIFAQDECCDFALKIHNWIIEKSGKDFELSSYKMIVVDMNGNHYTNDEGQQCVEYYLNTEVQIGRTPWFDDCSQGGWKIATGLEEE